MYNCKYQGSWLRGQPHGQGKLTWSSGASYRGSFEGGVPNGDGTFTGANGEDSYKGHWLNGFMHGSGTFKWKDGSTYKGDWKRGLFSGLGTFTWPNGVTLSGNWKNCEPIGKGYFTLPDARERLSFNWDSFDPSLNGLKDFTWPSIGIKYIGHWEKGKPRSKTTFTLPGGKEHVIDWDIIVARKMLSDQMGGISVGNNNIDMDPAVGCMDMNYNSSTTGGSDGFDSFGFYPDIGRQRSTAEGVNNNIGRIGGSGSSMEAGGVGSDHHHRAIVEVECVTLLFEITTLSPYLSDS